VNFTRIITVIYPIFLSPQPICAKQVPFREIAKLRIATGLPLLFGDAAWELQQSTVSMEDYACALTACKMELNLWKNNIGR
jgi:hypothetical protein